MQVLDLEKIIKKMKKAILLLAIVLVYGCKNEKNDNGKLNIVTTTF